jgi:hypothetical protein
MKKNNKILLVTIAALAIIALVVWYYWDKVDEKGGSHQPQPQSQQQASVVNNFDDCVSAGYQVAESYPRQCKTPDGKTFTEDIGNELEKTDLIRISSPRPNDVVQSPLKITGEARGFWFNEASFPIKIYDADGKELAVAIAGAKSDWMTDSFVPFEATLEFQSPGSGKGILVLQKDNPSGLKENDDSLTVPIKFGKSAK